MLALGPTQSVCNAVRNAELESTTGRRFGRQRPFVAYFTISQAFVMQLRCDRLVENAVTLVVVHP
jgi:hypothetical protein